MFVVLWARFIRLRLWVVPLHRLTVSLQPFEQKVVVFRSSSVLVITARLLTLLVMVLVLRYRATVSLLLFC